MSSLCERCHWLLDLQSIGPVPRPRSMKMWSLVIITICCKTFNITFLDSGAKEELMQFSLKKFLTMHIILPVMGTKIY